MSLILSGTDGLSDVDGSAATPAIRGTDANTGIFFGADIIGFAEGGAEVARFNADAQFVAAAGTALLPVITTTGDVNTGIFFPAADTIAFSEGGVEAMRINASGNLQTIGTISVGNATPSTSGAGITFPATQSASSDVNTLDDYEEGTWTPSIGGNATYTGQSGRYTKIGNFVSAICDMAINVIGTGSTSTVSGLPFAAGGLNFGGALSYWTATSRGLYFLAPQITGTTFWFIDTTSAMTTPNNSAGIFQNGTRIIVTVTYQVY